MQSTCKNSRLERFNFNLPSFFIEPETLAAPRRWKLAISSGSASFQLISVVQDESS